ncbi:hypothetical protein SAMN03159338_4280 [Sphingomonas sp. NFR04]|uniref:hypothetical protein n=1 Tax=Sphingomonas sp. NFR04 TaxID=1566283 RepID=UPI0008DF38D0|nr:hypothetical protein [Sphingomonas sp. NFR04]SFK44709.1 hypothetical protein SAMN03159338_4280 [Sphingomonas sp. NFR04]
MEDGSPALEVGFAIDMGNAFDDLAHLQQAMNSTEAKIVADAKSVEKATGSMVNLGAATAQFSAFGTAATRELRSAAQESRSAEKAGESLARQLERQAETYGKTASEIRSMRAEQRALNAEQQGLTELAGRIRALNAELVRLEAAGGRSAGAVRGNGSAMAALAPQAQDAFTQISMGTNALNVLAIQGGQAAGQMIYLGGAAEKFGRFMLGPWGLALTGGLLVLGALTKGMFDNHDAAEKAAEAMKKFQERQSDIGNFIDDTTGRLKEQNKTLVLNAILTRQAQIAANEKDIAESRKKAFARAGQAVLRSSQAASGSTTSGVSFTDDVDVQRVIKAAGNDTAKLAEGLATLAKARPSLAKVAIDVSGIGGQAILAQRENEKLSKELRGLGGDTKAFANASVDAVKRQAALAAATTPLEKARAQLAIVEAEGTSAVKAGGAAVDQYRQKLVSATLAVKAAEDAQKKQTAASRAAAAAGRREETQAERLGREADATNAQTKNLYALADAYGQSGGAALVAEARVKAESQAIKEHGDVAAFVARQANLVIAQRVADAVKSTATLRAQADVQAQVNAAVAAGTVPASEAARLVRDQIADLPLLQAAEAAQQQGLATEAKRATAALADQRAERQRLTAEEDRARIASGLQTGSDRLAELREELRLIGATDEARAREMAEFRGRQEVSTMKGIDPAQAAAYVKLQGDVAAQIERNRAAQDDYNALLTFAADKWDLIARNVQRAGQGMADAFGSAGRAVGDLATIYAGFNADRTRLEEQHKAQITKADKDQGKIARENARYALQSSTLQIGAYGDMARAAKGFFGENTAGYQALATAEKAFRAVEFALSVRAMAQDAAETVGSIARSGARAAAHGVEAVAKAIASLPFPLNLAAGAATAAAIASLGIAIGGSFGGGGARPEPSNTGTGTVLGDTTAKSDSVKRAIDQLKQVDTLTNVYSRQMLESLRSIDSQIGGVAAVIVRGGDINASAGVATGFNNSTGKAAGGVAGAALGGALLGPLGALAGGVIGKLLGGLFGTRTDVTGSGIYGGAQSLESILGGGFNGQAYSDITKTKKFLGVVSGRSYSTQYGALDPSLSNQFTLILRSFNDSIKAAAGPLGESTEEIQKRLNGFVVNIGKIDLKGLTGEQIQEKLNAVFGAAADNMATAAFPLISQFQRVGEGAFETLTRVATTVEQVTTSLDLLGSSAQAMGLAAKLGLADQFDSVSALNDAVNSYFEAYYSTQEQAAAKTAQLTKVFGSLGLAVPPSLAAFRQLVEAQDLTTAAGQATYATLLKLAPAFADLQQSMAGAKSAADVLSERQDLERQLLELQGKTDEIRKLDLAKLDASNRALQLQIYAIQDAQEAAKAADELRQAWSAVGDSITDEIKRIRGLSDATGSNTFASLLGQFNAATAAARGGDQEAAKSLPQLSQALLSAAADAATSRQELDRVQAQTAASLQQTYDAITAFGAAASAQADTARLNAAATAQAAAGGSANDNAAAISTLRTTLEALIEKVELLRTENNAGNAGIISRGERAARVLENVTQQSGGDAISIIANEPLPTVAA